MHWPEIVSYQEGIMKNGNSAQKHKAKKQHEGGGDPFAITYNNSTE